MICGQNNNQNPSCLTGLTMIYDQNNIENPRMLLLAMKLQIQCVDMLAGYFLP